MKGLAALGGAFDFANATKQFDAFLEQTRLLVATVERLETELRQARHDISVQHSELSTMRGQLQRMETWLTPRNIQPEPPLSLRQ